MVDVQVPRTVLGFDFGRVRIGIAVGQELTATASPLPAVMTRNQQPDWLAISRYITQWQPDLLVVGLPYQADGTPSAITQAALSFSQQLFQRYQRPVETIDERLSSQEAEYRLLQTDGVGRRKRRAKGARDSLAAALILESWFNHRCRDQGQSRVATEPLFHVASLPNSDL